MAGTDHTIPELLEAYERAERLGLAWTDPLQRAVAERATDEEWARELLASAGHQVNQARGISPS